MNKGSSIKKNAIANLIGQFYNIIIGIILLPLYLKYLGNEAFGLIGFFTMISSWMLILDLGLSSSMAKQTASLKHSKKNIVKLNNMLRSVEIFFLVISFSIIILCYFFNNWIVNNWLKIEVLNKDNVAYCIFLMGIIIVLKWISGLYKGIVIGLENQVWFNLYSILINSLKFIGGFLFIKYISQNYIHYFEYQLIIGFVELIIIWKKVYNFFPKSSKFIRPSLKYFKSIMPFTMSIAYTSILWIFITNIDKLILSKMLPLKEYGYFSLIPLILTGIIALSSPLGMAFQPRITSFIALGKQEDVVFLYKKVTQLVSAISFSVSSTVSIFSFELLYSWSGNFEASIWCKDILFWYSLGTGILLILSFQYFLQLAYGNLKYHVIGNSIFGIFQIILVIIFSIKYGAIGAAVTFFLFQLLIFCFWPQFVHSKFLPGIHKKWIYEDVLPFVFPPLIILSILKYININLLEYNRVEIFSILLLIGGFILFVNLLFSKYIRSIISNFLRRIIEKR